MNIIKIKESVNYVKSKVDMIPEIGIILGSGLGDLADKVEERINIKYENIPNMPKSTVVGHAGQYVFGKLNGKSVVMMQGRVHYYEGHKMDELSLPIHIMKYLGIKTLIVTNAAGGVNEGFKPGDLMIIKDHINFAFTNPLIGKNEEEIGPRFPDMSNAYDKDLVDLANKVAKNEQIEVKEGIYVMMTGPTYETPAEIRMIRILGGDAVGMSTVPDVITAKHCGLKVLGISCITNMAAGILDQPLNHAEVMETSNKVKDKFIKLVSGIIKEI
ncbi:purine-nucleoside phosphorylase [Clostridium tetanomorphum]|uniref:Purine nucleoside phosphorylase n=1 Tax=Clostridium tetanomorphum TaxID=1553 RepID=A0A923E8B2_CLOTT|nr:purine-nucleoside phosphorylase [Clostridium tetanomorphum]KAJ51463.1 purine nucleoside phosphorylase [Clostridium tetanomorphum DSM 665]MBC2396556.1 purine-nucleoside phosphorylase [Clostridium tetanomorphum]MBP1863883.1 purine-nucleoside phosphorylase [Clostridium tetanomorphum]NRS84961.1 purine-nucleoside phosphorylase [Clostridium tetanomorphum]NRZ98177.1 purine-nucleoside phosphorylase [Clostridium tetanomorphum]